MIKVVTASEMRAIDEATTSQFGVPSIELMESAASAVAQALEGAAGGAVAGDHILVICGTGNNGGDGAAMARILAGKGAEVSLILLGQVANTKGDARRNFDLAKELSVSPGNGLGSLSLWECRSADEFSAVARDICTLPFRAVVDAIFGTGLSRPAAGIHAAAIQLINRFVSERDEAGGLSPVILSVDIPSGLNADIAEPIGDAVLADITVAFTVPKIANVLPPASHSGGRLRIEQIGSPTELLCLSNSELYLAEGNDAARWLRSTRYAPASHKNMHGRVLVIAGSAMYTGAAVLVANAAMRTGAGLVTLASSVSALQVITPRLMPEVITAQLAETETGAVDHRDVGAALEMSKSFHSMAIGSGLDARDARTRSFVREVVSRSSVPAVIDADGLNSLSPWPEDLKGTAERPLILTPHPGEMQRLLGRGVGASTSDRIKSTREFAVHHSVILVLKGEQCLVAAPDGRVVIIPSGNAGTGTAGAGDTLTGIIAGFIAQARAKLGGDADIFESVTAAVYTAGVAADLAAAEIGMRSMVASDIIGHLSEAFIQLDPRGEMP